MKIVVFCDTFRHVARFARAFADAGEHELHYLTARRMGESMVRFAARQLVHATYAILIDRNFRLPGLGLAGRLIVCPGPLTRAESIERIRRLAPQIGLHSMEVIYRDPVIAASGMGILNAHIGMLPDFRGRSVFEWSLLYGRTTGTTVFFIDGGIDTGSRIVAFFPVAAFPGKTLASAKRHLFSLAPRMYRAAIDLVGQGAPMQVNDTSQGKRYYVMSGLFLRAVENAFRATEHDPRMGVPSPGEPR
jgi:Formyl transferase